MDQHIQHDPRTKKQIKDILYAYLYSPVLKQFSERLNIIIVKNSLMRGVQHQSFSYKGEFYSCDVTAPPRKLTRLDPRLHSDMDAYLKDIEKLNRHELPYVLGYLNQVLNASNSLTDYLSVFPASIHRPIENLIASCPCRACTFTKETQDELINNNKLAITMLKERLMANLII